MVPNLTLITGKKCEGKTQFIKNFILALKAADMSVTGIVSPGIYENGKKIGITAEDIFSGQRRQLAYFDPGWDPDMPIREWRFDTKVLDWGNQLIKDTMGTFDVFILDEIGYLELEKGEGWAHVFQFLEKSSILSVYLVVRESLLPLAKKRWNNAVILPLAAVKAERDWITNEIRTLLNQQEAHTNQHQRQR